MQFNKHYFLDKAIFRNIHLRKGQYIYNEVYRLFPNEVIKVQNTEFDCFNNDSRIDLFLEKIKQLVGEFKIFPMQPPTNRTFYLKSIYENKHFYRLGESMRSRELRGAKV